MISPKRVLSWFLNFRYSYFLRCCFDTGCLLNPKPDCKDCRLYSAEFEFLVLQGLHYPQSLVFAMLISPDLATYNKFIARLNREYKTNPAIGGTSVSASFERIKRMPLEFFVHGIRNMPDIVMSYDHGLNIGFGNRDSDTRFFNSVRDMYRYKADWLEYLLLDNTLKLPELRFTERAEYKPLAELSRAWFKLAGETFLLSGQLESYAVKPAMMLYLIESELCEELLKDSGFISTPNPKSKSKSYDNALDFNKTYWDIERLKCQGSEISYSPSDILLNEAGVIANRPENTRFRAHWRDFLKTYKRCYREIERSPLNIIYLEDGKIERVGRGKRK